jgi:hypothetical protein
MFVCTWPGNTLLMQYLILPREKYQKGEFVQCSSSLLLLETHATVWTLQEWTHCRLITEAGHWSSELFLICHSSKVTITNSFTNSCAGCCLPHGGSRQLAKVAVFDNV